MTGPGAHDQNPEGADRVVVSALDTPAEPHAARLVSLSGRVAELQLDCAFPILPGALLSFENDQTIFFGQVESSQPGSAGLGPRLRMRVEQFIDREKIRSIQRLWNADPAG